MRFTPLVRRVENIIGSIDMLNANAYDRLIETIAANIDSMEKADILNIFNEFVQDLKNISLEFRGSSNQRIIDVKKSREENRIILWEGDTNAV